MSSNEVRERAVQIARLVLVDDISILEAAIALSQLVHSDPTIASEKDADLMVGIYSEIDHLPIGRVRKEWHPDFLPEKDKEIAKAEKIYREQVISACERIIIANSAI